MITTITLNPAVDKTITIEDFSIGKVNRVLSSRFDAGGKGINVSKGIHSLEGKSRATGILAGKSGEFIKGCLDSLNIENDFVFIDGETRTNIKIVDKLNGTNTDINGSGPFVSGEALDNVYSKFSKDIDESTLIVFSGSVPQNVDKGIYGMWIKKAKGKGAKTILDADGELLKRGLEAGPYLVKPNIHELEALFGEKAHCTEDIVKMAKRILEYDVQFVVVSLGGDGALFVKRDKIVLTHGIKVEVNSTVGAGDSMVAALALAIDRDYDLEKTVKLSVACGTASVMTSGTQAARLKDILELERLVKLEEIRIY